MARITKMQSDKFFLASGDRFCPKSLFILSYQRLYIVKSIYIYIYICKPLTAYRLYMNYRCYQIILRVKQFEQIGSGAKCWLDIYYWEDSLAATGRKRDTEQNVLQTSF